MTDSQPNKPSSIQPNPRLNHHPSQVSTNHVRVHAAHDRERDCYNSFTLYRGCTRSPWVRIILEKPNTHCTNEHPYTFPRCVLGNHYKTAQWFYLTCNVPTEVSLPLWASHPPRSPLLCLIGSSCHRCTHTTLRFNHHSFTEHPSGSSIAASPHNQLVHKDKTLPHTMPDRTLIGSWLYYFHGWSLHEPLIWFGYDNYPQASSIAPDRALNRQHRTDKFPILSLQILSSILVGSK
jgi:hypothetical protein